MRGFTAMLHSVFAGRKPIASRLSGYAKGWFAAGGNSGDREFRGNPTHLHLGSPGDITHRRRVWGETSGNVESTSTEHPRWLLLNPAVPMGLSVSADDRTRFRGGGPGGREE